MLLPKRAAFPLGSRHALEVLSTHQGLRRGGVDELGGALGRGVGELQVHGEEREPAAHHVYGLVGMLHLYVCGADKLSRDLGKLVVQVAASITQI